MVGGVPQWIRMDGREGMDPRELILGYFYEDGEEHLPNCHKVVICGLSFEGGECRVCLSEEECFLKKCVIALGVMAA